MQAKKFLAKAFGVKKIVDVIDITYDSNNKPTSYTILDGDFLRTTWFAYAFGDEKPHPQAKMINYKWTLAVHKEYIIRELSSLEVELL